MKLFVNFILAACVAAAGQAHSQEPSVSFVVGGRMDSEGGDWNPTTSPLSSPFGIDFDAKGSMYVVELGGGRVFKLDGQGKPVQISGDGSESYRGDGGPAAKATYNGMHNCAITNDGNLLIADSWNHCVRMIKSGTGNVTTIAGTGKPEFGGDGGSASQASFNFLMCITLDPAKEKLHIADLKNLRIREIDLGTMQIQTIAGNGKKGKPTENAKATETSLVDPRAVAADADGQVYILERGGNALRVVRTNGLIETVAGTGQKGFKDGAAMAAQFGSPKHICVDNNGNVYIADDQNKAIRKYDPNTKTVSTVLGRGIGDPKIKLARPHGVCWHDDTLYVIDTGHNRILKLVY